MAIKHIRYGFLADDLLDDWGSYDYDASVAAYANTVETALREAYPEAGVEVDWQEGISGAMPASLQTAVEDDEGGYLDTDHPEIPWIEDIAAQVYESFEWLVEAQPA